MGAPNNLVVIADCSGGLNLTDAPLALQPNECYEAANIEWVRTAFGRRRRGSRLQPTAFTTAAVFTTPIGSMVRHVPGVSEAAAEVWAIDQTPIFGRKASSALFTQIIPQDILTGVSWDVTWASVDGCLFVAYQSAVNRLHVWDGAVLRRTGIAGTTIAPVVNDAGTVGTYPAVLRSYRVRWLNQSQDILSEPTPVTAFTPSGTGTVVQINRPAPPAEGETAWIVEASLDDRTYHQIAVVPIATTFYWDSLPATVAAYGLYPVSPLTGTFNLQKSYRFIAGADNRLLGFGTFEVPIPGQALRQNRVEISDIVGGGTLGPLGRPNGRPAESINTTAGWYVDLDESDSGPATGLAGPVLGNYYAFKSRQVWELRPTGDVMRPFASTALSKTIGAVTHQSIAVGEDYTGRGALYWWSHLGPYRYTVNGLEYLGRNLEGLFKGHLQHEPRYGDFNVEATIKAVHGVYYPEHRQMWWWVATTVLDTGYGEPNILLIYHTESGGWSQFIGLAPARCSAMLPTVQGIGGVMARTLKPHYAPSVPVVPGARLIMADDETAVTDAGDVVYATVLTPRAIVCGGPGQMGRAGHVQIVANGPGAWLTLETFPNLSTYVNTEKRTQVSLTPTPEETTPWVFRTFEEADLDEVLCVNYRISDASPAHWVGDRLIVPVRPMGTVIT